MASDTGTANPEPPPGRGPDDADGARPPAARGAAAHESASRAGGKRRGSWFPGSRLSGLIVGLNLLGLAILIIGALILNGSRQSLLRGRLESLTLQGQLIANVIDQTATVGEPEPALAPDTASSVLQTLFIPRSQRARLFDARGRLLADSYVVADRVEAHALPPPREPGASGIRERQGPPPAQFAAAAATALRRELAGAMSGVVVGDLTRFDEDGRKVVSVSIPIRRVRAVVGVLTLESGAVEQDVVAERWALIPFILVAIGVTLLSSLLLTQLVAVPVLRLARAADRVRLSRSRAIALPDLAGRDDELGDLTRSLEAMTGALSNRMEAIERFAADVAHELRNPMTSIRSAVETLSLVKTETQRGRLADILQQDVGRMERLITDISNASRLDAELARDTLTPLDAVRLIGDICRLYQATLKAGQPGVTFIAPPPGRAIHVSGLEGPLSQVIRNLIDNARSFSQPGGEVRVALAADRGEVRISVEDDGPGMPPDNLETVFERFYTYRPKGAAFGGNSGLGLAIARQIIETHSGSIWAENRQVEGQVVGARFVITLPRA